MARRQAVEQLPPFATIAPDDRRGALWIAALLSLIFVAMTLGARLYVRKHMLGRDDFAAMAAVALAVAQYAALFAGMPSGLGTSKLSVTAGNERKNGSVRRPPLLVSLIFSFYKKKLLLTSQAVFICGLYMAKLAVLLATERLLAATMKTVRRVCLLIRGALAAAALASILLITLRCATHSLLSLSSGPRRCSGLGQRWVIIAILDAVTETAILCVFYGLVWSLQMRAARKWMLTLLLGLRLLCPVFTGIYTSAIQSYANSSDPAVEVMSPLVWQQVALGYSLIAALLIALIPFLRSFHTGMVLNVQNMGSGGSGGEWGSSARSRDNVYRLKNLSTKISKAVSSTSQPPPPPRTVPLSETEVTRSTSLRSGEEAAWRSKSRSDDGAGSADGASQEPMVIQKTVDWSVQYEEGEARGLQNPGLPGYLSTETTYR